MLQHLALGRGSLDRAAHLRTDPEAFAALLNDPNTFVVGVCGDTVAVHGDALRACPELSPTPETALLLGTLHGRHYVAAMCELPGPEFRSLREIGADLCDDDAAVATAAVALHQWHRSHSHCPRCGAPTRNAEAGWERHCTQDASAHFPRTDPAVIVVVTDAEDRLLLARQTVWPHNRFSLVAGYVEPGETAEHAVEREVLEEVGLTVRDLQYLGSQPWPFPASLMLCYRAASASTAFTVDGTEIAQAMWVSRDALPGLLESGALLLPSRVSIARRAIEDWFGSPLD